MSHSCRSCPSLYDPAFEKDSCGFGLIAHMDNLPSHALVQRAIAALACLTHRGAIAADGKSGDGCGLLLQKPEKFLRRVAEAQGFALTKNFAVGSLFLSKDSCLADLARQTLTQQLQKQGLSVAGFRVIPINPEACGSEALKTLPTIEQIFVNLPDDLPAEVIERRLFIARRRTEKLMAADDDSFYVPSLSAQRLAYKGLVMPRFLPEFYPDLQDPDFESAIAVFHQRFSTNTLPQWPLAQPFRFLAHNGEINTIAANRLWSQARQALWQSPVLPELEELTPFVTTQGSDSQSLDNMLETLVQGGMPLLKALRILVPPAWQHREDLPAEVKAFFEYYSMHAEPWDGPAGLVFSDGRFACCALDRNGLRPARWLITDDRHIVLASETGVYPVAAEAIVRKGRIMPGQMLAVDTHAGRLWLPEEIDAALAAEHPYLDWLSAQRQTFGQDHKHSPLSQQPWPEEMLAVYEKQFLLTFEEREQILRVLGESGQEAVGSMGDDTPMAVLSQQPRALFDYFRQQFAQVTNPPIDPIRESIVMSLETCFGAELNIFEDSADHASRLTVDNPVLNAALYQDLLTKLPHEILSLHYEAGHKDLNQAIRKLNEAALQAVSQGKILLILDDSGLAAEKLPLPAVLALGAVHQFLLERGLRHRVNLLVKTATCRDPHHFAVLFAYGATAVYPYLAYEVLEAMRRRGDIALESPVLQYNYRQGIAKGLYKILSKMGISTLASYRGSQLFEIIGLHEDVVNLCFKGTVSRLSGANFQDIEQEQKNLHREAFNPRQLPKQGGLLKYVHGGEYHAYNPDIVQALHAAVENNDFAEYQRFADLVNQRPVATLRDLLKVREDLDQALPISEVENIESILKNFDSAGMSLGALSPEAHESLAVAMNRLGGRSNSGEGGEDIARYGTEKSSKIKQVASGRFGVTAHYLVNAEVLQIKIAQGAKPGEGGQLPGKKVDATIARLRYARPGVTLISPPPHHDIYSIEDLAQLIFDLKQVNPEALVSVKLVSEPGVGTIAAGVTKAYADLITISGYDGGTGASPLTSVKYAGSPWELGLVEAQEVLRKHGLRHRVRIQADGGLKTGLDVIKAAILGAESFGFGTAPMIAMGCKYLRICHLNNCATGVATQEKVLRLQHFKPNAAEKVVRYFTFIAQETQLWLARLGVRSLKDLIGRTDLLEILPGETKKQQRLDLRPLLFAGSAPENAPRYCLESRNRPVDKGELAEQMVRDCLPALEKGEAVTFHYAVNNTQRSLGARLSGEIAKRFGNQGPAAPITLHFSGSAGQSFGVWNVGNLNLYLTGEANDYVGKGMTGGKIVVRPSPQSRLPTQETVIIGNTCLYGATGGRLYAAGLAGERFAVRNSGAIAIVEGVGEHGCEYMTGGAAIILGRTGGNFGAGMTGGFALIYDPSGDFSGRYNKESIDLQRLTAGGEAHALGQFLQASLEDFIADTQSLWAKNILENLQWTDFWLVKPKANRVEELLDIFVFGRETQAAA
jgi:glutamate synthase (NADPH/NADH) large chain